MKKRWFRILFACLFVFIFVSCSSQSNNLPNEGGNGSIDNNENDQSNQIVVDNGRKIIYTAEYTITCVQMESMIKQINSHVAEIDGYISSGVQYSNFATYTYKVPTDCLNSFLDYLDQIEGSGNKQITSEDITTSYLKLEARISTLEASKAAYDSLLSQGNLTMSDIITINREIENITTELTELYSKKDQYDESLDYSKVTIRYQISSQSKHSFFGEYGQYLQDLGMAVVTFLLYSAPFLLIAGVIILIVFLRRRKKSHQSLESKIK